MEFAGHPVIGAGHLLFKDVFGGQKSLTLETKAGPVEIEYDGQKVVSAGVPHNIHVHEREAPVAALASVQDVLSASDINGTYPTVSIVKGVTYVLADLTERPDVFSNIAAGESPTIDLDEGWSPSFVGTMYYRQVESRTEGDTAVWNLRVRMIATIWKIRHVAVDRVHWVRSSLYEMDSRNIGFTSIKDWKWGETAISSWISS